MQTTVLFLIDSLQNIGGAEKNLLQVVSLLDPAKYSSMVFCLKGGAACAEFEKRKINVVNLEIERIYSPDAFKKALNLIKLIKQRKVKIVVTYLESSDFWGSMVARISGVPVVISSRRDLGFNLKTRHILAYRFINSFFDSIIAVCHGVKEEIVASQKCRPDKIITIYNGVQLSEGNGIDKTRIKQALGLDSNKLTVVMLANLAPIKGHEDFLQAASRIINQLKEVQFLLVGADKDSFGQHLRDYAGKLGICDNTIFTGFRHDIADILSVADIAVLPSHSEGLSNAILEYMAAAKPVVATDVGGNRELVIDGQTGFLVPSRDPHALSQAILKLLYDETLRLKMGASGHNRAKAYFTSEKMMSDIDALFTRLLSAKNGAK